MGFSPSEKHGTTTSIYSNIIDATSGTFTEGLTVSGTPVPLEAVSTDIIDATSGAFAESLTVSGTPVTGRDLYTLLEHQKGTGINGGTFTSGAWRTRSVTVRVIDEIGIALSSNQFTLPAGTYTVHIHLPSVEVGEVKGRLQNITDATTTFYGASNYGGVLATQTPTGREDLVFGRFTITASKVFEVQHICTNTRVTYGFGTGSGGFGDHETYVRLEIWQHV